MSEATITAQLVQPQGEIPEEGRKKAYIQKVYRQKFCDKSTCGGVAGWWGIGILCHAALLHSSQKKMKILTCHFDV